MKKLKCCLATLLVCLPFLCGCGMARDGYIEDRPAETLAPMESPVATAAPVPTRMPARDNTSDTEEEGAAVKESAAPKDGQNKTAK